MVLHHDSLLSYVCTCKSDPTDLWHYDKTTHLHHCLTSPAPPQPHMLPSVSPSPPAIAQPPVAQEQLTNTTSLAPQTYNIMTRQLTHTTVSPSPVLSQPHTLPSLSPLPLAIAQPPVVQKQLTNTTSLAPQTYNIIVFWGLVRFGFWPWFAKTKLWLNRF